MANFKDITEQAKQFWASRNGRQKAMLLGGTAVTLALVAAFATLLSTPDYKPLFTDMEPADAQKVATALDAQNIPHQLSADGKSISVPADKLAAARLQTASSQAQPHSGRMGFELFDKMSWGQTEFDEKVAYQRAMEGELERTIETLADVDSARVHLVMPTDSVFLDRQRSGKASVVLKLRRSSLSKDSVLAISRLVAGAVDGLKPEDVSIIDADSDRPLGLSQDDNASGATEEARLTQRLLSTLEPVVGADSLRASVSVTYDKASTEKSQEEYNPNVSAVLSMQRNEENVAGGSVPSGVPGTSSNVPDKNKKPTSNTASAPTQSTKSESAQYGVDRTITKTVTPAGRIQRITAAILVNDVMVKSERGGKTVYTRQPRSAEELSKIKDLAAAAIGFDATRGDVINVQDLAFSNGADEPEPVAKNWARQVQKTITDYSALLRPASLILLFLLAYILVIRPIQKHALSPASVTGGMPPALAGGQQQALAGGLDALDDNVRAAQLKQQAMDLVRQKPADTARALRTWVRED